MTREERSRAFAECTDTAWAKRREVAKKVATLLAENVATMPEVDAILEQAKQHLFVVTTAIPMKILIDHGDEQGFQRDKETLLKMAHESGAQCQTKPGPISLTPFAFRKQEVVQHHRRHITATGIRFGGKQYQNPHMLNYLQEEVDVIPISEGVIRVLTSNEDLVFKALPNFP